MKSLKRILLVITLMPIIGCIEEKSELTINPDGSGKVVYEATFQPLDIKMTGEEPSDPRTQLKEAAEEILEESSGVDTWKDISCKLTDDGRIYFKGTAFFPDINNLNIDSAGLSSDMKLYFTQDKSGQITIEFKSEDEDEADEPAQAVPAQLSEAELAERVKNAKTEYNETRMMMQGFLPTLKSETILNLPGQIKQLSNFEKTSDTSVRIVLDGARLLQVMDEMMQNEDWLKEQIKAGKNPAEDQPDELVLNEMLFGQRAPIRVTVAAGAQDLFDYKSEVAAAEENYETMLKKLGLQVQAPVTPVIVPSGQEVKIVDLKIGAVRLVKYGDQKRGIRPFNYDPGYTLSFIAELPEPVLKVSGGSVEKAVTDTGSNLLHKDQWQREIHFPKLAKDNKAVLFDVELLLPDENVKGLQEVSGKLECLTASGSKEVDLGITDLKAGARGKEFGALIQQLKPDTLREDHTELVLRLNLSYELIESINVYTEDGGKLDVSHGRTMWSDKQTTLEFSTKGKFPPKGRIVLNVYEGLSKNIVPFKITNISLMGQPL